jgi:hypothetical protein
MWEKAISIENKEECVYDSVPLRACENWESFYTTRVCRSSVGTQIAASECEFVALMLWQLAVVYD